MSVLLIKLREFDGDATLALRDDLARLAQTVCDWDLGEYGPESNARVVISAHDVLYEQITHLVNHVVEVMAAATECPADAFILANHAMGKALRKLEALANDESPAATQKLARLVPALYAARDQITGQER
ncbi:hypothetical protein ACFV80_35265 [Streptomyces sp. NPDC059862]|uniref:hypothetical protein n=1 Tax=Streptomyces sp. NPDC059862 TaxID=3346975 RepID=UPI003646A3C8